MTISILFWLSFALPGYALARRVLPDMVHEQGPLQTLAISTLAALVLLSPVSIIGYIFELPLIIATGWSVVLIAAALVDLTHTRTWGTLLRDLRTGAAPELILLAIVAFLSLGVGAAMEGDAVVHLARIRQIIDSGLTNTDPFCTGNTFFPIYHTNLLHVLYAIPAQLGAPDHFTPWFASLFWANLFIASGIYTLARTIWGSTFPAMVAVLYMLVAQHYAPFIAYPNQIAPHALLPIFLALVVRTCTAEKVTLRHAIVLAAAACVIGQVHGLYAGFALVVAFPPLVWTGFKAWRADKKRPAPIVLCALALLPALAFPAVTEYSRRAYGPPKPEQAQSDLAQSVDPGMFGFETPQNYKEIGAGMVVRDPFKGFGARGGWRYGALALGAILGLRSKRRRETAVYALAVTGVLAIYFGPPITTAALAILREGWVIDRLMRVPAVALAVLAAGGLAYMLEPKLNFWWARSGVSLFVMFLALIAAPGRAQTADQRAVSSRAERWNNFFKDATTTAEQAKQVDNRYFLDMYRKRREIFSTLFSPGETVLAHPISGMFLVAAADCRIIAPVHASLGVRDLRQRKQDLAQLMTPGIAWEQREQIMRKYDISHISLVALPSAGDYLQRAAIHGAERSIYPPENPRNPFIDILSLK
jgi:hypothetical protein